MASDRFPVQVAVLSAEHRILAALRALLEAQGGFVVTVAATAEDARVLLDESSPAAVVVGLGSPGRDSGLLRAAVQAHRPVVVGSRGGLDLDTGPDAILEAVWRAVRT